MSASTMDESRTVSDLGAYATMWTVGPVDDLIHEVEDQFESWLRGKLARTTSAWDPPTEESGYHIGPAGQELLAIHHDVNGARHMRLRLTENNPSGRWRTTVTASAPTAGEPWVRLHVTGDHGVPAKVPNLAGYLLGALVIRDGQTWMSSQPQVARLGDVERVASEVTDIDRQGLYIVAGTAGDDSVLLDAFVERVPRWTRGTRGLAQVAILDPDATAAFADIVGDSHAVSPWTIRTFDVDVDPAVASDGRRHRVLGTERLAGPDGPVTAILSRAARHHAVRRPLPPRFLSVDRMLSRIQDRILVESVNPTRSGPATATLMRPSEPSEGSTAFSQRALLPESVAIADRASAYLTQLELVKELLNIREVSTETLTPIAQQLSAVSPSTDALSRITTELEERRDAIVALEKKCDDLDDLSLALEVQLADLQSEHSRLADEARWLRRRLAAHDGADIAYGLLPDGRKTVSPSDFDELARMLPQLEAGGVIFTGDTKTVVALSAYDDFGRVATTCWHCLLALQDYVQARLADEHAGNIRDYLENVPSGRRGVPPNKFAGKETARTMQEWGNERVFAVPHSVDPSGQVVMEAHFKLGRVGMISPRLYYYDNFVEDGRVYVGYIGRHLTNTKTS